MDRQRIEARFRKRALRLRRDYLLFSAGAAFVSLVVAAVVGFVLYAVLTYVGVTLFRIQRLPSRGFFLTVYAILFLGIGYTQYRLKSSKASQSGWEEMVEEYAPLSWLIAFPVAELSVVGIFFTFPALVFHFLEEVLAGRFLFNAPDVESLAFEILLEGGDRITPEFLQHHLDQHPQAFRRAIRLLLEMDLLILVRATDRRVLTRSLSGKELVEAKQCEDEEEETSCIRQ